MRKCSTDVFTLGESRDENSLYPKAKANLIHYCSYCCKVAESAVIDGDYGKETIFFCRCKDANAEWLLVNNLMKLEGELLNAKRLLNGLQIQADNNQKAKMMKYEYELRELKKKYSIDNDNSQGENKNDNEGE